MLICKTHNARRKNPLHIIVPSKSAWTGRRLWIEARGRGCEMPGIATTSQTTMPAMRTRARIIMFFIIFDDRMWCMSRLAIAIWTRCAHARGYARTPTTLSTSRDNTPALTSRRIFGRNRTRHVSGEPCPLSYTFSAVYSFCCYCYCYSEAPSRMVMV